MKKKKLTKAEKMAKAKDIIEQNRELIDARKAEMKKDQEIMRKAGAVQYSDVEAQEIITTKLTEKLHRQRDYREAVLTVNVKHARLGKLNKEIEKAVHINDDGTYEILESMIEWRGIKGYTEVMIQEYELDRHYYKLAIANMNHLKKALKNDELSDEEIDQVANGTFVKTEDAKKESEKKEEELKLKEKEEDEKAEEPKTVDIEEVN